MLIILNFIRLSQQYETRPSKSVIPTAQRTSFALLQQVGNCNKSMKLGHILAAVWFSKLCLQIIMVSLTRTGIGQCFGKERILIKGKSLSGQWTAWSVSCKWLQRKWSCYSGMARTTASFIFAFCDRLRKLQVSLALSFTLQLQSNYENAV